MPRFFSGGAGAATEADAGTSTEADAGTEAEMGAGTGAGTGAGAGTTVWPSWHPARIARRTRAAGFTCPVQPAARATSWSGFSSWRTEDQDTPVPRLLVTKGFTTQYYMFTGSPSVP